MVVVPVDAEINKTQHVAQKNGEQWAQRGQIGPMRHRQFQHHNGNEDGNHPIAKGFQSSFAHGGSPVKNRSYRCHFDRSAAEGEIPNTSSCQSRFEGFLAPSSLEMTSPRKSCK
jgi:hypothetical protein